MVRQSATTTEARPINNLDDVEVGDTIDVSGKSFLPKSNLEVTEVDPDWSHEDAAVFVARIPNRSNARDYCFKVTPYGNVVTTTASGNWDNYTLEAAKIVDVEFDDDQTDEEDDDVIASAEDKHGHTHEAVEVRDAICIRETFNDGSTSRFYLRADGPLDLDYEVVRVGDDDTVGIYEVFPDGSKNYHSVPTAVYDAIADRVSDFVDDPEYDAEPEVATDGGEDVDDPYDVGDEVYVDFPDRNGVDFGTIVRKVGPSHGTMVYRVSYHDRDGDAQVSHHKLGTVDYEAGAYTVTYERDGVVETAELAGSAIVETFEQIDGVDVIDVTRTDSKKIVTDGGRPVDGGDVDRCDECGHYAAHTFDHAPSCPSYEPITAEPDVDGTDLRSQTHDALRARLSALEDERARLVTEGTERRYRRVTARVEDVRRELVRRADYRVI